MPSPNDRVSLSEVARRAGVSTATASRALQGLKCVKAATRQRVRDAAVAVGYRPDPMMSAFSAYRRTKRGAHGWQSLALVGDITELTPPARPIFDYHRAIAGFARHRAEEMGYHLDFYQCSPDLPPETLFRQLYARGVLGIFVLALQREILECPFLQRFPVIVFGLNAHILRYHNLGPNWGQLTRLAVENAVALGYRRIGFLHLTSFIDPSRTGLLWWEREKLVRARGPQPEIHTWVSENPSHVNHKGYLPAFRKWLREEKPDVIISDNISPFWWLKLIKKKVPDDVAYINIGVDGTNRWPGVASTNERIEDFGPRAIEILDKLVRKGERGQPDFPFQTLLTGVWQPGKTAPGVELR